MKFACLVRDVVNFCFCSFFWVGRGEEGVGGGGREGNCVWVIIEQKSHPSKNDL